MAWLQVLGFTAEGRAFVMVLLLKPSVNHSLCLLGLGPANLKTTTRWVSCINLLTTEREWGSGYRDDSKGSNRDLKGSP